MITLPAAIGFSLFIGFFVGFMETNPFKIYVADYGTPPFGYGYAWHHIDDTRRTFIIIPFNILAVLLRRAYIWSVFGWRSGKWSRIEYLEEEVTKIRKERDRMYLAAIEAQRKYMEQQFANLRNSNKGENQ